jgi:hypothetical protein
VDFYLDASIPFPNKGSGGSSLAPTVDSPYSPPPSVLTSLIDASKTAAGIVSIGTLLALASDFLSDALDHPDDPSVSVWTDGPSNVSRLDPSGAVQIDADHPSRNRKVVGSNPTSGST